MTGRIAFAFRNIWRARTRTVALMAIISVGVASLVLIAAGYDDLFFSVGEESLAADGDMLFVDESQDGAASMPWEDYLSVKAKLMGSGMVTDARASTGIEGIIGGAERSAPCSGIAVERETESEDGIVPVSLGESLAKTLGVERGDLLGGLVNDRGMTFRLEKTVTTEALLKDRFYLEIPIDALLERDGEPVVSSVRVWLKDSVLPPSLNADADSPGYRDAAAFCASIPELKGYTLYSMPKKNTRVDRIVRIYRANYRVVLVVVALTLFLAFLNALTLSVHERQRELGTLRAIGTPLSQIRFLLLCETFMIAALSWCVGITLSVIVSAAINANGGLSFAAPPGETSGITVGFRLSAANIFRIGATVVAGALTASVASGIPLGKSRIVQQLEER